MHQASSLFLRLSLAFIGLVVLFLCLYVLPRGIASDATDYYRPILIGMYVTAVPFFGALYHANRLLRLIDQNRAFSIAAVNALKAIRYCGLAIGAMYAAGLPYIYYAADRDDAPGVFALGLIITGSALIIAAAAAVFQRLVQAAVDIKTENDLTV